MEASVKDVDAVEDDGGGLEDHGLRRVPANGAGEMQCVALAPKILLLANGK